MTKELQKLHAEYQYSSKASVINECYKAVAKIFAENNVKVKCDDDAEELVAALYKYYKQCSDYEPKDGW